MIICSLFVCILTEYLSAIWQVTKSLRCRWQTRATQKLSVY